MTSLLKFTDPFLPSPSFFTGAPSTDLVPNIFPISVNGRPYMVDQKSNQFSRGFEPRVRDSVDQSTAPGEAAINPQGLWRRGEVSWHLGAGQKYSDTADAQDYRFLTSKGINPWTKGELSLLNTVQTSLTTSNTNLKLVTTGSYVYVLDGNSVKYSSNPFAATPTWTTVTGLPSSTARDIASDGINVYVTFSGITNSYGLWKIDSSHAVSNVAYGHEFGYIDFVKGYFIVTGYGTNGNDLYYSPSGNVGADDYEHPVAGWQWIGSGAGPNAIYIAGAAGNHGSVYRLGITSAGVLETPINALELPLGEMPTSIFTYLGGVMIGTNKGVRYATADTNGDLTVGALIPTTGAVYDFASEGNYVWFTWSNFDGTSSGLGRLDLSTFTEVNKPAYASDLMNSVTGTTRSVVTFDSKRIFSIAGSGIYAQSTDLVVSGHIVTGTYRWGIPDRKFVAKFDIRTTPLAGTVTPSLSLDSAEYLTLAVHSSVSSTESVCSGPQTKFIEAKFKIELARATTTTGPTLTRWMARAYASPARSQVFRVPILMHHVIKVKEKDYYFDVETELAALRDLVTNPRVVNYQENTDTFSVVVEDLEFQVVDGYMGNWDLEGTCVVTMRSVQD